ncbi:Lysine histidine transporter 1, partial [Glycine soja]
FFYGDINQWLFINLKPFRICTNFAQQTHIKFGVILWHIWKRRNSNVFEDALLLVHKVLLLINSMVHDIFFSKSRFIYHRCKAYSWINVGWKPPDIGWFKFNVLTTSIVAPPLLSLPYAFTFLSLVIGAFVTFYSYNLISRVLEHHAQMGKRQLRFRDMARDILGQGWGHYFVGPIQFAVCYGAVVACNLLGGLCMKAIYLLSNPNGTMKLYEFVIIFGCFMLILAQIPSFHSLRHINLVSLVLCLAYSAGATIGSIYIGKLNSQSPFQFFWRVIKRTRKGYSLKGDSVNRLFGIFNVIAIIATTYGNGIIPAIQVYLQPTNEVLEQTFGDPKSPEFSKPNVIPRVISRSLATTISTTIAAMLPFFGDINSLIGAFGFIPLDFILPMVFYNLTFKPSKRSPIFWLNVTIVVAFSALGAIAAVRQIVLDAKNYQLFANI